MPAPWVARQSILSSATLVAMLLCGPVSRAQEPTDTREPAHVAYVDGAVTLEREGQAETADVSAPVVVGDRLTTAAGRIEILFPDGTALDVDEYATVEILSPTLIRLLEGRAMLSVAGANDPAGAIRYQVDTPVASARTDGPGVFRIAILGTRDGSQTELAVLRGDATLATERGATTVRAGERTVAFDNGALSSPQAFNSARFDAFDRWAAERREARVGVRSAQYLPSDLRTYSGTLERHGSWQYNAPYGYVWYPTVAAGWQPYYHGYWSPIRSYGWTWIGVDLWSWPTHHYGRWGHSHGSWFWVPGRTWGPAWVSWADAPGYVSWCPLGFDGRPVFALSIGGTSRWPGWVVLPRTSFGFRGSYAHHDAVAPHRLPRTTTFTARSVAPVDVRSVVGRRTNVAGAPVAGLAVRRPGVGETPGAAPVTPAGVGGVVGRVRQGDPAARGTARRLTPTDPAAATWRTGPTDPPAAAVRRPNPSDATAGRGVGPVDHPASSREFRRPLPDAFRAPAYGDRAVPTRRTPTATEGPVPRDSLPRAPEVAGPRYREAPPAQAAPQAAPPPQAVPRMVPHRTESQPQSAPRTWTPPPPPPAQRPPAHSGPRYREGPASSPPPNSGASGSSHGAGARSRTAPAGQPSGGSPSQAVPRSEGRRR